MRKIRKIKKTKDIKAKIRMEIRVVGMFNFLIDKAIRKIAK